jgi:SagB-type dehydrogenase family enzyme
MRQGGTLYSEVSDAGGTATMVAARRVLQARRDAWERMTILSPDAGVVDYPGHSAGVGKALAVIGAGFPDALRSVPSAGAVYPFELYILAQEDDGAGLFHVDPARRVCRRIDAGTAGWDAMGLPSLAADDAFLFVVSRPWLSMRKYGDRGYLYTQIDVAHLAANLVGIAGDVGFAAELRLGFARGLVADTLDIGSRCREVHSVLHLAGGKPGDGTGWAMRDARGADAGGDGPSWLEAACWTSLSPLLDRVDHEDAGVPAVGARPLTSLRSDFGEPFPTGAGWSVLSRNRRSSKGFAQSGLGKPALWRAVAACQAPLVTDVAGGEVGLTLLVRDVPGQAPGVYPLTDAGADVPGVVASGEEIVHACMHQAHLRNAAAFVVLHAERDALVAEGRGPRDTLFRVGALGQLLYLGATEAGAGVTGVGGFDAERWRRLVRLSVDQEPLYLVAFGADDAAGVKWDQLQTAYAQNER